jgi:hypothetical protein
MNLVPTTQAAVLLEEEGRRRLYFGLVALDLTKMRLMFET